MSMLILCLSCTLTQDQTPEVLPHNSLFLQFPLAFTDVAVHQLNYAELGPILRELTRWRKSSPTFSVQALCCRSQRGNRFPKFVLWSDLVLMVFELFHSSSACGHVGILKIIGKIRQNFIWKGMDRNIAGLVRSCQLSALSKPAQNSQLVFLASKVANHTME